MQRNIIRTSLVEAEMGGSMSAASFVTGARKCRLSLLSDDMSLIITTTGGETMS